MPCTMESISPPAITDAICPETFTPTECISRKFDLSSSSAIFCTTRADMGKAEIPAAPIMGFIFSLLKILSSFASITPPIVSTINAISPSPIISSVLNWRNSAAFILEATVIPKNRVITFASTFCAVSESELSTPHSRIRLPNMRKPISASASGANSATIIVTMMGKRIFVSLETFFPE